MLHNAHEVRATTQCGLSKNALLDRLTFGLTFTLPANPKDATSLEADQSIQQPPDEAPVDCFSLKLNHLNNKKLLFSISISDIHILFDACYL